MKRIILTGAPGAGKTIILRALEAAGRAAAHVKRPYVDHAALLYDEHGLPK